MASRTPKTITDIAYIVYPEYRDAILHISHMPLSMRSTLIKSCQAQTYTSNPSCPLGAMVNKLPSFIISDPHAGKKVWRGAESFKFLKPVIEGPVSSSILLDLARALPVSPSEIEEARLTSWRKEAVKIEEQERPPQINWDPIFKADKADQPILPFLPSNPTMNRHFHQCLLRWRSRCSNRLNVPRTTKKNMSRATRREFEQSFAGQSLDGVPIFSQEDWQRHYHKTGEKLGGETEMRQKWYPSGAKPRTYFAQGGHHYQHSAHLQDIFSDLVNSCVITNHVTRLQPTRLVRREGQHYRIYDLATFTSNMAEQRGFVKALAEFCYGWEITHFDVRAGLVVEDLGDVLMTYYEECCYHPEVSYERLPGFAKEKGDYYLSDHGVASMLGIFGNLMTCTFAHGVVVAQTVDSVDLINVAGDDGIVLEEEGDQAIQVDFAVRAIGNYERTKTFSSNDEGAICLKRPLTETIGGLQLGKNIIPPSLITTSFYIWSVSDPRYEFHSDIDKQADGFSVVGKDWMRALRSAYRNRDIVSDDQLLMILQPFARLTRASLGFMDHGYLPHVGDPFFWPPIIDIDEIRTYDPLDSLLLRRYRGVVVLPTYDFEGVHRLSSEDDPGTEFQSNSSLQLRMASMLGYVERESLPKMVSGNAGYEYIRKLFVSGDPELYSWKVVKPLPEILFDL